ncbi:MAG: methyltransferase [Proteobacteria bacterium]|nr:methyltransferase [Pseudomonadota bacterium]
MINRKLIYFITLLIVGGLGGIVAQTVLLREMLILFSGNEFSIGIIIGSWVIWEAIGSFIGGRWNKINSMNALMSSIILFSVFFPASIYFTRVFKTIASIDPGVGIGLLPTFYSSVIILLPTGFLHGLFFTLACSAHNEITGEGTTSTGKVYFIEMLGTIIGGVLVNYLLIIYYNSFQIAMGVALISALTCSFFACSTGLSKKRIITSISICLFVLSTIFLTGSGTEKINNLALKRQWPGQNMVYYGNSHYQNIVVVQNDSQYTFFSNGIPAVTTPIPDIAFVEEFVHLPMLAHPSPENILIIGAGAGGIINELLKYPSVKKIDYVERDPLFLKVIRKFSTPLTQRELDNPIVNLYYIDGKRFLTETSNKYDVILLGLPPPYTLQANRFFTQEFFTAAKARLNYNGILTLTLTGSLTYYSKELKELNVSIIHTVEKVFSYVYVLPGDFNLFMASDAQEVALISPALLYGRLRGYGIKTGLITSSHLNYRFEEIRRNWFLSNMQGTTASINRDFSPKGLFYHVTYINLLFSPYLKIFFDYVNQINIIVSIVFIASLFLVFFFLQRRYSGTGIVYAISTTGFAAMILELILLFSFQIFYGYIFHEIGILITTFMAGMAAGSLVIVLSLNHIKKIFLAFIYTEAAIALFCFILLLILLFIEPAVTYNPLSVRVIFFILLFVSGFLAGMEFPLANKVYRAGSVGRTAGILYGADLLGGWIGGIIGGIVLLPILGLSDGCIALITLKISSFVLLLTSYKK